jgi:C1A family cysteine protease
MSDIIRKYGWKPEPIDGSKMLMGVSAPISGIPNSVDLTPHMPPVFDQGQTNSCTGNGLSEAIACAMSYHNNEKFIPSRLFIYYNERLIEGSENQDCGGIIHDGIRGCNLHGMVDESTWPFDINNIEVKPPQNIYDIAIKDKIKFYAPIDNTKIETLKATLAHGYPIVFGFTVYSAFESEEVAKTGILNMPQNGEEIIGGHCINLIGFSDEKEMFLCRNSWGPNWGQNGNFWMPFDYVTNPNLASDFWIIRI